MNIRRGISLIEIVVVLSGCSVVMVVSAGLVHRVLHVTSATDDFFEHERNCQRLLQQVRQDVHMAYRVAVDSGQLEPDHLIELSMPADSVVRYRRGPRGIVRIVESNGIVQAREDYRLDSSVQVTVEKVAGDPERIQWMLHTPRESVVGRETRPFAPARPMYGQIVAVVGRNHRFVHAAEPQTTPAEVSREEPDDTN